MKRAMLFLLILAGLLSSSAIPAMAKSDNAALVVHEDGACDWHLGDLYAIGTAKYTETKDGKWILICHGSISEGEPPRHAMQARSTSAEPLGFCTYYPTNDTTPDWHITFSPSGKSSFVCHGDVNRSLLEDR